MAMLRFRTAGPDDAEKVAQLHADSWRRHYRGAYADAYLDGDVVADRLAVWTSRLSDATNSLTILAEDETGVAGFLHVIFDLDREWGSLVDNLHVARDRQRTGAGTALLTLGGEAVATRGGHKSMYLWVLEQNTAAQQFYRALGGTCSEKAAVPPPGGVPERLNGSPMCFRYAWPDTSTFSR